MADDGEPGRMEADVGRVARRLEVAGDLLAVAIDELPGPANDRTANFARRQALAPFVQAIVERCRRDGFAGLRISSMTKATAPCAVPTKGASANGLAWRVIR